MKKMAYSLIAILGCILLVGCTKSDDKRTKHEAIVEDIEFEHIKKGKNVKEHTLIKVHTNEEVFVWTMELDSPNWGWETYVDIIKTDGDEIKTTYMQDDEGEHSNKKLYIGRDKLKAFSLKYANVTNRTMPVIDKTTDNAKSED